MWTYYQRDGAIRNAKGLGGRGYSGHNAGLNNPDLEAEANVGPIPRGMWKIGPFTDNHPSKGPLVAELTPVGHDAHGRTAFLVHGDNRKGDNSGSEGCIVINKAVRQLIADSGDTDLEVVA